MQGGSTRQQVEGLKDESDFLVADAGQLIVVQFAHQLSVQPVLALGGRIKAPDEVHERGLAGTGRAHDGNVLVAVDGEVHAAQCMDLLLRAHVVGLPQILGANHGRIGRGIPRLRHAGNFSCHLETSSIPAMQGIASAGEHRTMAAYELSPSRFGMLLSIFTLAPLRSVRSTL